MLDTAVALDVTLPINKLDDTLARDDEIELLNDDTADDADERITLAEVALPGVEVVK